MKIKEEFRELIPPLTIEEYKQLENNCIEDGIREPILTWNGYIIDGHNRFKIAEQWNLEYDTQTMFFQNEGQVKEWMILNQFGRRNLSNYQRSLLALKLEDVFSEKAKEKEKLRKTTSQISDESYNEEISTKKELGKIANVSHDTIMKVKKIKEKATDDIKEQLSRGEVSINQVFKDIKKEEKKANFEKNKELFELDVKQENLSQQIILGDSIKILPTLEPKSFDLLLSDPPYGMNFKSGWSDKNKIANDKIVDTVSLFEDVLKECVPLLKDDAHFYLFGNINYINEIKPIIEKHLNLKNILIWDRKIIGMGDLKTFGNSYDIIYFGYTKTWKDLNGNRDRDILSYSRIDPSKNIHPTEKPLDILEYLIKKSSNELDKILEPFAGGGSTLLACKNLNRLATGIEIEEEYFNLIKERV